MRFYSKRQLRDILARNFGINVSYVTLCNYENKGYLAPMGRLKLGKRRMPVYTDESIANFVNTYQQLRQLGKVKK